MPELKAHVRRSTIGDGLPVTWVSLDGFLDASTVLSFESALSLFRRDERGDLVLDFHDVLYANSTAIGTILNYRNLLLEAGRELILVRVNPQVAATFELLGLSSVVPCLPDEDAATRYLLSAPAGQRDPAPFLRRRVEAAPVPVLPRAQGPQAPAARRSAILMIAPEENRFTDITKMRLLGPHGRFHIITSCPEALHHFDELDPDLIVLEDPMRGSEDFLWAVKTEKGKSLVPVIKLYWTGTDIEGRKDFKVWEDDFLVEPFEVMEFFALCESELRRAPSDRRALLHQTHFEFRTRPENLQRANDLAASLLKKSGLAPDAAAALATAVAEAIENAARHGNAYAPEKTIDVVFLLDREKVAITVTDSGPGFDFRPHLERARRQEPVPPERLRQARGALGKLGIALMVRATDSLDYLGPGNSVRLTRRLSDRG